MLATSPEHAPDDPLSRQIATYVRSDTKCNCDGAALASDRLQCEVDTSHLRAAPPQPVVESASERRWLLLPSSIEPEIRCLKEMVPNLERPAAVRRGTAEYWTSTALGSHVLSLLEGLE